MAAADDPELAAAELALGLLDGEERAAALRRVLAEPGFAAAVERWRERLAPLFLLWPEVAPPEELEARIEASLNGAAARPRSTPLVAALAAAACIVAIVALTLLLIPRRAPVAPPVSVAVPAAQPAPLLAAITPTGKGKPVAASYDAGTGELRLAGIIDVPGSRVAQLWAIRGQEAPRPLGLLQRAGPTRLVVAGERRGLLADGVTLAISIEPEGGSPTGLPTGPVVATGVLARA